MFCGLPDHMRQAWGFDRPHNIDETLALADANYDVAFVSQGSDLGGFSASQRKPDCCCLDRIFQASISSPLRLLINRDAARAATIGHKRDFTSVLRQPGPRWNSQAEVAIFVSSAESSDIGSAFALSFWRRHCHADNLILTYSKSAL